jgi:hypothetical protein
VRGRIPRRRFPALRNEWTKKLPDEWKVIYTSEFVPGTGSVITAHVGELVRTRTVQILMTREGIEAKFKNL